MRSTMRCVGPVPPRMPEIWKNHDRAEVSTFPTFLPDLYRLWQVVKDPTINRQCCLSRTGEKQRSPKKQRDRMDICRKSSLRDRGMVQGSYLSALLALGVYSL